MAAVDMKALNDAIDALLKRILDDNRDEIKRRATNIIRQRNDIVLRLDKL